MLTVEQALEAILARVTPLPAARVPLREARRRVLAEEVAADIDNPPFDNSAVDGYAVRAEDTRGASAGQPVLLRELAEVPAGQVADRAVTPGTCMRVMTGAPIPPGADAMVMVEDTGEEARDEGRESKETGLGAEGRGPRGSGGAVRIFRAALPGDHIRRRGEDVREGTRLLAAGQLLGPAEVAMLAAMGCPEPLCVRLPRAAILSTGDELVEPAERPGPGQIRDCNRFAMAALAEEAGAVVSTMLRLPDTMEATESALRALTAGETAARADVILTSGGVSVGDRDYVKPALERLGTLDLWRVKMKPGKPVAFGRIGDTLFFGLPGNPVSTMVTFELFVRPALWKMAGRAALDRLRVRAVLTDGVKHKPGRREYVRAAVTLREGTFYAVPTGAQGSGMLSSMLGANALLVIPEAAEGLPAGETVEALVLNWDRVTG